MNPKHFILPLALIAAGSAWAAGSPKMSPLEVALTECAGKVKTDSEGMPDQKAMAECMKAKGFKGPEATPEPAKGKAKSK